MIDRWAFISVLAGGLVAVPLAALAQQGAKVARMGYLASSLAASPTFMGPSVKDCATAATSRAATS